jgi:hypothetical protein
MVLHLVPRLCIQKISFRFSIQACKAVRKKPAAGAAPKLQSIRTRFMPNYRDPHFVCQAGNNAPDNPGAAAVPKLRRNTRRPV